MSNQFEIDLPENGFGAPCCICKNRSAPVEQCRPCPGYTMRGIDFNPIATNFERVIRCSVNEEVLE